MHWITSTLCKVCIHSWHALVVLDFFIDLILLFSIDFDLKMHEMES